MVKDILIVGLGASGLYAWKMAADLKLKGTVIEAKETYGGQVTSYYPEKNIHNFPAIEEITGKEAMDSMYNSIKKTDDIELMYNTTVANIEIVNPDNEHDKNWFFVKFSNKKECVYKRILFTDGLGFLRNIKIVDKDYDNIFYSVNSKNDFKDKDIIVCGGGDSTFDWANELSSLAKSVAIIHRRNDFRAKAASVEKARQNNVKFFTPYIFLEISEEENGFVKKIRLEHAETKEQIEVKFDALIVQYGSIIEKEKFENLHLKLNEQNKFIVDNKMETSVEGIFAAGDCNHHDAKIKNLVSSIYEAMQAIINIEKIINNKVMANRGW